MELDPELVEFVNRLREGLNNFARAAAGVAEVLNQKIEAAETAFNEFMKQYRKAKIGSESFEHFVARMDKKERARRRYYRIMKRNHPR